MTKPRKKKPHWYRIYQGECPVCGSDQSYRERVYGKKPKKLKDRIVYLSQQASFCCGYRFC